MLSVRIPRIVLMLVAGLPAAAGLFLQPAGALAATASPQGGAVLYGGQPLEYWTSQAVASSRAENLDAVVAALSAAFESDDLNTQVRAADALRAIGPEAEAAAGTLAGALDHIQPWVRTAAMDALAAMGSQAVPALLETIQSGPEGGRVRALMVLSAGGPEAASAIPALQAAAREESGPMRARLEEAIQTIRNPSEGEAASRKAHAAFQVQDLAFTSLAAGTTDWPGFHGPRRDAICTETGLLDAWPSEGPKLLWQIDGLGKGYSTISIADGKLFTMGDRPTADGEEAQYALAYDLESRRELWATRVGPPHSDGPRCTPTFDEGAVYVLGTAGDLIAMSADDGRILWQRNLPKDFGGQMMSGWKFSESPLIDGQQLICTPGGPQAVLAALNKKTGQTIWQSTMPTIGDEGKDGAGYSSAIVAEIAGRRQYVQMLGRGVIGVDAETGRFLWGYNRIANNVANITAPIARGDYVFATTSYKTGSALLKIERSGEDFTVQEVYFLSPRDFENHHGGVVLVGDYVYGGDGQNAGHPVCLKLTTGEIQWKTRGPASGSAAVLYADGHLIFRYDRGPVALVEATPEEFRLKGMFTPITGSGPAWAHPVIHQGKLYLRHGDVLGCYDLRK